MHPAVTILLCYLAAVNLLGAGALALWVLGRAFPLHRWPLPRPVRRLLAVLDGLCAAFYLLSLCLPPLHLLWVFVPWVYALPGALTLYLLPAR